MPFIREFKKEVILIIFGLLSAMALLLLLNSSNIFSHFLLRNSIPGRSDYLKAELKAELIERDEREIVALIGASTTREAYNESYLNQKARKYYFLNLGISGNSQPIEYYFLSNLLDKINPAHIVLTTQPGFLFGEFSYSQLYYVLNRNLISKIYRHFGWREFLMHRDFYLNSLILSCNRTIKYWKDIRVVALRGLFRVLTGNLEPQSDSAYPDDLVLKKDDFKKEKLNRNFLSGSYFTSLNIEISNEMMEILSDKAHLTLIDLPMNPLFEAMFDDDKKKEYFKTISNFKNINLILRDKIPSFEIESYNDMTHLNGKSRLIMSDFLLENIFN